MSDDIHAAPDGATELQPEERLGLKLAHITYRHELNAAEHQNIAAGVLWALGPRRQTDPAKLLTETYLQGLHKRMLGDVWTWAGRYRQTDKNIGGPYYRVPLEVRGLLNDAHYWVANGSYPPDELAIRFHHKLVAIHPFPNGNGRHSRLMGDLLATALGRPRFSWGGVQLVDPTAARADYIAALRAADDHDIGPLIAFARSDA